MLPEELSNNLCSLKAKVVRLTVSVAMVFDKEGTLVNHRVLRAYIKSAKRFTYEEAFAVIEGKKKSPHAATLHLMVELCKLLKKKRYERGSIDFALSDTFVEINSKGEPIGIKTVEYDITHQLVEEFMLKANEVVAKHLTDAKKPVLYRVHEEPAEENFQDFFGACSVFGVRHPCGADDTGLAEAVRGGQKFAVRPSALGRLYPEHEAGLLFAGEHRPLWPFAGVLLPLHEPHPKVHRPDHPKGSSSTKSKDLDLEKIALNCSEQERVSFKAESSVKLLKKLRLMQKYFREDPLRIYPVVVTKVKPFGLFFEMPQIALEGFLHISELGNDYFYHNPERNNLTGRSTGRVLALGDTINVALLSIDCILLETKWMIKK